MINTFLTVIFYSFCSVSFLIESYVKPLNHLLHSIVYKPFYGMYRFLSTVFLQTLKFMAVQTYLLCQKIKLILLQIIFYFQAYLILLLYELDSAYNIENNQPYTQWLNVTLDISYTYINTIFLKTRVSCMSFITEDT